MTKQISFYHSRFNGQAYNYYMPQINGDAGDIIAGNPNTFYSVTNLEYLRLKKWAEGHFVKGIHGITLKTQY